MHKLLILTPLLILASGCSLKITASLDGKVEDLGCSLRRPIPLYSSKISALYGTRWTHVDLDSEIETETVPLSQRDQSKTLNFFEIFYKYSRGDLRSTRRAGARLDSGSASIGFATVYDSLQQLTVSDSTHNNGTLFHTAFFGYEDLAWKTKETWELDVIIKDDEVTAASLTVPVMRRIANSYPPSFTFTGRNQKLCVLDATP